VSSDFMITQSICYSLLLCIPIVMQVLTCHQIILTEHYMEMH